MIVHSLILPKDAYLTSRRRHLDTDLRWSMFQARRNSVLMQHHAIQQAIRNASKFPETRRNFIHLLMSIFQSMRYLLVFTNNRMMMMMDPHWQQRPVLPILYVQWLHGACFVRLQRPTRISETSFNA
ncbi:hypothetical protein DPMN_104281 [Dreissena polymorpha]|uniref:Uncharacterized protein n=1 Tax=Dreissena polymorpha TaxID=45954 RepID=A0A9D4K2P4_DREPO|nr:hypothetical protein DPMN_104281 [Dreissena polymorpha]